MLRLIIDTSLGYMGLGIAKETELLASTVLLKPTTVTTLGIKTVDFLFSSIHHKIDELSEVAVSAGPGTFTSLRVGISLAKGICMGLGIPLIPVSTLGAMALTIQNYEGIIVSAIDGKNSNIYISEYILKNNTIENITPESVIQINDILEGKGNIYLSLKRNSSVFIVGFGIDRYKIAFDELYRKIKKFESLNIHDMLVAINNIAHKKLFNISSKSAIEYIPVYLREPDVRLKTRIESVANA